MKNDEEKVRKIIDEMISPKSLSYRYFTPHSFAQVSQSPFGYSVDIASYIIYEQLVKMSYTSSLAKLYLDWMTGM